MSSEDDKTRGKGNEAAGNLKQAAGSVLGDDRLKSEGKTQEHKGETQQTVGKVKDKIKGAVDGL